jgi:hypothetical protein
MQTQPAGRTPTPGTAAWKSSLPRTVKPAGRFLAELGGMCAVMCAGGGILSFAAFELAKGLGYPNLVQQSPELSAFIIAICLSLAMAVYMAVRGHGRRHNLEMTGSTIVDDRDRDLRAELGGALVRADDDCLGLFER